MYGRSGQHKTVCSSMGKNAYYTSALLSFLSLPFPISSTSACIHMLMYGKAETKKNRFSLKSRAYVLFRESVVFQM